MGRRLNGKDLAAAKHETEVFNSMLKRGLIKEPENILRTHHIVCGCGAEGCIFLSHVRSSPLPQNV